MFITNNKLIENISNEFNIEKEEANNIINNLFGNVTLSILNKRKFYMDKLGTISIDDNLNVILSHDEENFDDSLESIDVKNNDIKNIFLEKSIYKSIFKNIKDISKEEEVHIENFGYFHNSNMTFKTDPVLQNIISIKFNKDNTDNSNINNDDIIKKLDNTLEGIYSKEKGGKIYTNENNEIVEDINELDNKSNIENIKNNNNEDDIIEIIDNNSDNSNEERDNLNDSIDNNVIESIWKNKSNINGINDYKKYDDNYTIDDIVNNQNDKDEIDNMINKNNEEEQKNESDYPPMKEYTKEELLDINHFDRSDLENNNYIENNIHEERIKENMEEKEEIKINNQTYSKEELLDINENDGTLENSKKENLDVLNNYEKEIKNIKHINVKKNNIKKNSSSLFGGILKVICIIIFVLVVGVIISRYYNDMSSTPINNSIENQKLYDIVNTYFNASDSASLSYITSKDMYYWDVAKSLYGDATYWPLIYSYNSDKYRISNIIRKGSSISYRSMANYSSPKDTKFLNNTLSKSYISIYPILVKDKKLNHALWALKLSAYYDLNVFKNNASIMPEQTYNDILKENSSVKNIYNNMSNNENIFISFIENIKQKIGIKK